MASFDWRSRPQFVGGRPAVDASLVEEARSSARKHRPARMRNERRRRWGRYSVRSARWPSEGTSRLQGQRRGRGAARRISNEERPQPPREGLGNLPRDRLRCRGAHGERGEAWRGSRDPGPAVIEIGEHRPAAPERWWDSCCAGGCRWMGAGVPPTVRSASRVGLVGRRSSSWNPERFAPGGHAAGPIPQVHLGEGGGRRSARRRVHPHQLGRARVATITESAFGDWPRRARR